MKNNVRKLTEKDLPLTIEDVPAIDQMESQQMLGGLVIVMGLVPLLYGAYQMIFGPDHIMINRFSGPTFWEIIQLNPGLVASIGFGLVALGRLIRHSAVKKVTNYIDEHFMLCNRFGSQVEDARLVGQATRDGHLKLYCQSLQPSDEFA